MKAFSHHGLGWLLSSGYIWAVLQALGCITVAQSAPLIDAFGHSVNLVRPPQRIVSLSPNLTEILFKLGVSRDRVAGVTRFCDFPPDDVAGLPRVGGIVDPSVEGIIALHPDLVVATRGNPVATIDRLRDAGVTVFAFESQGGVDLVLDTMQKMAALVRPDRAEGADSIIASFANELACLHAVSDKAGLTGRPRLFYYDPASPDWTTGRGTHVSEAIAFGGGRNVGDRLEAPWPRFSIESLLTDPPDWILVAATDGDTSLSAANRILRELRRRPGWRALDAVQKGKVCLVPADWLLRPGPRLLEAIRAIGRCIHPELDWGCAG